MSVESKCNDASKVSNGVANYIKKALYLSYMQKATTLF